MYAPKQLNLLIAAVALGITSILTTSLRVVSRRRVRGLGIDDYLMLAAEFLFVPTCVFFALAAESGAGRKDPGLTAQVKQDVARYIFLAEPFYLVSLVLVKTSICLTLLTIATSRRIRLALQVVVGLTIASNIVTFVVLLSVCRPLEATWIPMRGKCERHRVGYCVYFISAWTLLTDYSCAIIPFLMLRNVQMNRRTKIIAQLVLSLGVIASTGTVIRIPYIHYYQVDKNRTEHFADLALWSAFECGMGIIAGSSAALKPLFGTFLSSMRSSASDMHQDQDVEMNRVRPFKPKGEQISMFTTTEIDIEDATSQPSVTLYAVDRLCPHTVHTVISYENGSHSSG